MADDTLGADDKLTISKTNIVSPEKLLQKALQDLADDTDDIIEPLKGQTQNIKNIPSDCDDSHLIPIDLNEVNWRDLA
ncbi:MAG: hypothetical protein HC940_06430 [Acaryochloris sp. SU_5_25]|nr:hypothetical protein [Acaryochloris sp. SU_5_25]